MRRTAQLMVFALFPFLLVNSPASAQETEHQEHGTTPTKQAHEEEHAEAAGQEEHGEHGGRPDHLNEFAIFLGGTDEHDHPTELTWGLDYKHRVAERWGVGGLFDYAGGSLRNAIVAASVTWWPVGKLTLMAAPGIEFHRGRSPSQGCGCAGSTTREEPGEHGTIDEDATYFVMRFGVGWEFHIGKSYGVQPQVNLDLVEGENVWVYGLNLTYAW